MAVRNMKKTLKWKKFELLFHVSTTPSKPQPQSSHFCHLILSSSSFSSVPNLTNTYLKSKPQSSPTLTPEEISKINLLLPRLCLFNHLPTAIQLTTTALTLPNPPPDPKSLSLSILIHSLTLQPDLKLPMSLLTRLSRKHPPHPYLTPISTMLIASYLKKDRPKDALKRALFLSGLDWSLRDICWRVPSFAGGEPIDNQRLRDKEWYPKQGQRTSI
ncbi:hypothetical protein GOBAR_AA11448 [Gossypium barbadense]|uniref:Uncharacterized protein n=1 Tax=Gossypium barbadense TaxID=3634 RepID=A0A2P5Y0V1_GOSBA|nr:hypothetical protein GOBAR_AA11448 [Gossypium barbadense]